MEVLLLEENFLTRYWPMSGAILLPESYEKLKGSFTVRYRSRGAHQPGSGNYSCVHLSRRGIPRYRGMFILFPGCYYQYDDGWSGGYQYYSSMDCIGDTYRFVKSYRKEGRWVIQMASAFKISRINSQRWSLWEVASCRSYQGNSAPRTTSVDWVSSSGWTESQYQYPAEISISDYAPKFNISELTDIIEFNTPRFIDNLIANAYVDAISRAPVNEVNNIGNLLSAYDLLKSLMAGPQQILARGTDDVVKGIADAWLQYRYVFQTTAMDIHETAEYLIRSSEVKGNGSCKCNGIATQLVDNSSYIARCSVTLTPEDYGSLQTEVGRLGLELNAYAAWDMVPWSFVVDWFFHIGDRLEYYNKRNRALRLTPGPCWYSITKNYSDECLDSNVSFYYRWKGGKPTTSGCFVDHPTSNSTIVKRAVDVWALSR